MRKQLFISLATVSLALVSDLTARADYSNTLMSLSPPPIGYWPLQEQVAPPTYYATNLGTLGTAANGQYCTWWQSVNTTNYFLTNNIVHVAGATTTDDSDTALATGSA